MQKELKKAYMQSYRILNRERIAKVHKAYVTKWNKENKEKVKQYGKKAASIYRSKNRKELNEKWKTYYYRGFNLKKHFMNEAIKHEVLCAYGKENKAQCANCLIHDIDVLTIDHINNDGAIERKKLKIYGGVYFYKYLKNKGYPSGYQVLCMNCNLKKEVTNRRAVWKAKYKVMDESMPSAKGMM